MLSLGSQTHHKFEKREKEKKKKREKRRKRRMEGERSKGGGRERERKINNVFSVLKNNREMFPKKDSVCVRVCVLTAAQIYTEQQCLFFAI